MAFHSLSYMDTIIILILPKLGDLRQVSLTSPNDNNLISIIHLILNTGNTYL